ncbi:uncharacterized protein [Nicotiana sylvestris]|uniref:uncharacterized protein n=1 Tax=Nicotiana sylvestris TaxID=4096 RepID=UPI00388C8221
MTTIFHYMIHKEIKVYVDDVIIKSNRAADYIANLRNFFDMLRKYNLKLHPVKCVFGVLAGKLLGFIVSRRGIELDPSKVKAIQELPPPNSKKDVMRFLGRLNYISRFIAQSTVNWEDITEAYDGWRMFFDGAANFKGVGIGAALVSGVAGDQCFRFVCAPDKKYIDIIPVKIHNQSAYCAHVEEEMDGMPWLHDIKEYLSKGEYPERVNHTQKCILRRLSNHFFHSGGYFYRRTPDLGLLRCVTAKEASKLLEDVHVWICGPHMNDFILAKKILRAGYFWMTMEIDYIKYVLKCFHCQVHVDMIKVPPNELNATSSPWPFAAWGMDVIGPIDPTASKGHRFVLVAIDYLTK